MTTSGVREFFEDENQDKGNDRKQGGPMRTQQVQHRKLNQLGLLPDRKLRLRVSLDLMNGLIGLGVG